MNAARLEACRAGLSARGWAGALATPGVSFEHLTGARAERTERLVALGIPVEGAPWLVVPAFEAERLGAAVPDARVVAWREDEDPFAVAVALAGEGIWGLEPTTAFHDATRLAAAGTGVEWVDGAELFEALRRRKDADELAALERAIAAAWEVFDAVVPGMEAGVTEAETAGRLVEAFAERGFEGWALVQFGPGSAVPHGEPGARPLAPGAVLIDWGGWRDGFGADLTRSFWWDGGVADEDAWPAEYREVHRTVRVAQRAAFERIVPGVACGDVDEAARSVIREAGWGEAFVHRLGHGLGREIHEPPYLVAGSRDPLRVGDVVTVEPGIYLPGRFGVRWEDDVRVGETGAEVLSIRA
ncbi:MAG TPA: Xaa-Pro peptidase family protein [Gemmatimonadota bacterium]|nr:Xaa-Pro peptidase family protein [Gemmatimonadota bacterium]